MPADNGNSAPPQASRLLSCFLAAEENGLDNNSIMLCEVVGDEIQSISLRVAADAITHWNKSFEA